MPARLSAFLVWAAVAAGVVFWALRLGVTPIVAPPAATVTAGAFGPRADLSRLLGTAPVVASAAPAPVAESARFRLLGVIAEGRATAGGAASSSARRGVALLVVDGKPPRAYRVGAAIDGALIVQSVARRSVAIGPPAAPPSVVLELAPPPTPATGEPVRLAPDGSVVGGMSAQPVSVLPAPPGALAGMSAMPGMPAPPPGDPVSSLPPGMAPPASR